MFGDDLELQKVILAKATTSDSKKLDFPTMSRAENQRFASHELAKWQPVSPSRKTHARSVEARPHSISYRRKQGLNAGRRYSRFQVGNKGSGPQAPSQ